MDIRGKGLIWLLLQGSLSWSMHNTSKSLENNNNKKQQKQQNKTKQNETSHKKPHNNKNSIIIVYDWPILPFGSMDIVFLIIPVKYFPGCVLYLRTPSMIFFY